MEEHKTEVWAVIRGKGYEISCTCGWKAVRHDLTREQAETLGRCHVTSKTSGGA